MKSQNNDKANKDGFYEVYCKIESRKRLTDKQLEGMGWEVIGSIFGIASVNIKRTMRELDTSNVQKASLGEPNVAKDSPNLKSKNNSPESLNDERHGGKQTSRAMSVDINDNIEDSLVSQDSLSSLNHGDTQ